MNKHIVLNNPDFVPGSWKERFGPGRVYMFNPGIIKGDGDWIFAYRMIGPDGLRRIALCRLDSSYQIKKETIVPFSDIIKFPDNHYFSERARIWFADPRLFRLAGRLFVYWNSGMHEPFNHQFFAELDESTLQPIGRARELIMEGERRPIEKNWTFFGDGPFYAVYSIEPHCVMEFSLGGEDEIKFHPLATINWNNNGRSDSYGDLRGGAIPQRVGNYYYNFCHSVYGVVGSFMYAPAVYRFEADYPFRPKDVSPQPLDLANPFGFNDSPDRLNPAVKQVLYPCGAVFEDEKWIVSYGVNDEYSLITEIPQSKIDAALSPIDGPNIRDYSRVAVIKNTHRAVYVGFDFWGHGNIGDDLMIAGFQKALSSYRGVQFKAHVATGYFIESQQKRFPDILWHRELPDNAQDKAAAIHTTWVGPGATPFQLTCGDYVLKYWLEQLPFIKTFDRKCLVNVGAEQEIEPEKERFSIVANVFDKISTRDQHSADILTKMLGLSGSKIYAGADLANIILADYIDKHRSIKKKFNLGVIIAADTLSDGDIAGVKDFLVTRWRPTSFIAGDMREIERHECFIYRQMIADLGWWARKKLVLSVPDYMNGDIRALLSPIDDCSTIISSRYHGLLIAAWMGCKVAAIARSSKIPPLAEALRIPVCYPPLTRQKLETMQKEACVVSRNILMDTKEKALEAVRFGMD
ncbi:MAG: hypothetical protein CVU55_08340 [Deltaproteobacteria bacterium HGW-Deltaproteobacteria-13]|jgi:hypothetical protein|nr:MAG: hypothetical protein CVU55_08340 [Deltaproteobacteria bacterium HGW-Deltaproteobacteria-13]